MMKLSPAFLALAFALFLFPMAQTRAANDAPEISPPVAQGGMTCFTITPAEEPKDRKDRPSCDSLCGQHGAACSGVTNGAYNPPTKCEDPAPTFYAICRCCEVER